MPASKQNQFRIDDNRMILVNSCFCKLDDYKPTRKQAKDMQTRFLLQA